MKIRERLGKILSGACIYFTAATLILYTCGSLLAEDGYQRVTRLERAMRAAKMAGFATSLLGR